MRYFLFVFWLFPLVIFSQTLTNTEKYVRINASGQDPLYTTYAPSLLRSDARFPLFFKMDYSNDSCPVHYSSSYGVKLLSIWKSGEEYVTKIADYFSKPVITYSFPDLMIMEYEPYKGIRVKETFLVYSYNLSIVETEVRNSNSGPVDIEMFNILDFGEGSVEKTLLKEPMQISVLKKKLPFSRVTIQSQSTGNSDPLEIYFSASPKVSDHLFFQGNDQELLNFLISGDHFRILADRNDSLTRSVNHSVFRQYKYLRSGESVQFRYLIGVKTSINQEESITKEMMFLKNCFLRTYFEDDLMLYFNIPQVRFTDPKEKLLYISSLNLARSAILPSFSGTHYNTFINSTNIKANHDISNQSISAAPGLIGYVYFDARSAENAFRYFITKGKIVENWLFDENEYHDPVDSPLLYNWIGFEIYTRSKNKEFLKDVYQSGICHKEIMKYSDFAVPDKDPFRGFFFIHEAESLSKIAKELGKINESQDWLNQAKKISENFLKKTVVNYTNEISYDSTNRCYDSSRLDLIRGILSLWTGTASIEQAGVISSLFSDSGNVVNTSTIKEKLCMSDRNDSTSQPFSARITASPLWLYIVYEGLKRYGFNQLSDRVASQFFNCYLNNLSQTHDFPAGCCHQTQSPIEGINGFHHSILIKLLYLSSVK